MFFDCHSILKSALLARMAGASLNAKKILIVEDSYPIAESILRTIADVGFATVGPVDTAARAMREIEQHAPDSVLLSAVAVAKLLRRRRVPFVILTAYSHDTLPDELRHASHIAKPMSETELIEMVRPTFEQ